MGGGKSHCRPQKPEMLGGNIVNCCHHPNLLSLFFLSSLSFFWATPSPTFPCLNTPPPPQQQMMQQQAALMAATQGSYLNPMAAIAAAQMQQMAAFNVNGLVATPMTPSSGGNQRRLTPHSHHATSV